MKSTDTTLMKEQAGPLWRAVLRLFLVLLITGGMGLMLMLRSLFGLRTYGFYQQYSRLWGERLMRWVGFSVKAKSQAIPEGCILVCNHRSYTDIPVLMTLTPATFLAKQEVRSWPVIGWAARAADTVFVNRESAESRREARATLKAHLDKGASVMVFPEGTTVAKEELLPLRPGMFHTAAKSHLPIVPIAIEYQDPEDAWTGDESFVAHFLRQFRGRRKFVSVSIGPVMHGTDGEALKERVETWMHQEISRLSVDLNASVVADGVAAVSEQTAQS